MRSRYRPPLSGPLPHTAVVPLAVGPRRGTHLGDPRAKHGKNLSERADGYQLVAAPPDSRGNA